MLLSYINGGGNGLDVGMVMVIAPAAPDSTTPTLQTPEHTWEMLVKYRLCKSNKFLVNFTNEILLDMGYRILSPAMYRSSLQEHKSTKKVWRVRSERGEG